MARLETAVMRIVMAYAPLEMTAGWCREGLSRQVMDACGDASFTRASLPSEYGRGAPLGWSPPISMQPNIA
jgi:hypothetical protein